MSAKKITQTTTAVMPFAISAASSPRRTR